MYTYLNIFLIVSGKRQLKNNHQGVLLKWQNRIRKKYNKQNAYDLLHK